MSFKETLLKDQMESMRRGDRLKVSVLRLLRAAIEYEENARNKDLDDAGIHEVISRQIRQRNESIEQFRKGNRPDLAEKEEAEAVILKTYLPPQLSREELAKMAQEVIAEVGATGPQDKGKVMGRLMPMVKGKAQGGDVNAVVTELLSKAP